jgi:hypothetical protein
LLHNSLVISRLQNVYLLCELFVEVWHGKSCRWIAYIGQQNAEIAAEKQKQDKNMNVKNTLMMVGAAVLLCAQAQAIEFKDYDLINKQLDEGKSYSSDFNIKIADFDNLDHVAGYNSASYTLSAPATVIFTFTGFKDGEEMEIQLGKKEFEFEGPSSTETLYLGPGFGYVNLFKDLSKDGILKYTVTADEGKFKLVSAELTVNGTPISPNNAPDGGTTMLLLGSALAGLGFLRRKF